MANHVQFFEGTFLDWRNSGLNLSIQSGKRYQDFYRAR